jgi:general secretion pathway protein B
MSYILDALRKADAQRQRDPARGIHAQPLGASAGGPQPRGGRGVRLWSAAAVGVLALSSAGWYLARDNAGDASARQARVETAARPPASLTTVAQAQTAPVVGNNPAPSAAIPPPMPAPAINPAPAPSQPINPAAGDPRLSSQPMLRGGPQPQPGSAPAMPAPAAGVPPSTAQVPPTTARGAAPPRPAVSAPVPPAPPTPPVAGLPPDAPKLVLSGGVYSTNPAQRMLIVNGQVFNEGSEVAAGVTMEEIKARTVVLRFRGARYTVAY